ncbi:DUF2339 domain-containing protein [Mycolicibacterium mengxianglii]|uniref:DUF2339 domain-containing protein n=1 Tax=Mycolicibacterium mengxianglii TaxID=2736649 RepID=UPI0018EEE572|nr:DUF2339 domain-containing protein [Mycolicibacterium mengxianglii]
MTESPQAAVARLSVEFTALTHQMSRVAAQLVELERTLYVAPHRYPPPPPAVPAPDRQVRGGSWVGKVLAVAGVAVTLIGVVLLLVLAAQAGILAPPVRVGAGVALAAGLVVVALRSYRRPGGRIGAIALAATGIAAAYMDVIAATTIYHWVPPVAGLLIASAVGGGGLTLARRWDSQQLGLLVLIPLAVLAPIVSDGVTVLLIAFMLALSAAALPVQLGKDWVLMYAARTLLVTLPLLVALLGTGFDSDQNPWLLGGACGLAVLLAVAGAVLLLPGTTRAAALAAITAVGATPALSAAVAVDRRLAVLLAAVTAVGMLALVLLADRLPGMTRAVVATWSALSAAAAVVAVTLVFNGSVEAPVLLALALVVAVAGRHDTGVRRAAFGLAAVGGVVFLAYAPPRHLLSAVVILAPEAVSVLAASALVIACAVALCRAGAPAADGRLVRWIWAAGLVVGMYAVTAFTVTFGVLVGGRDGGFLAGHMVATICWTVVAAALFGYALRLDNRDARTAPIAGGLALTGAATAKLMLFDLGTLDGIFRVVVFIVVGLVLLAMGAGYARSLAQPAPSKGLPPQS